jgi:hypothetical protein
LEIERLAQPAGSLKMGRVWDMGRLGKEFRLYESY